jgi:hypothetical protein
MQPDQGVVASRIELFFEEGRWGQLEALFGSILASDPTDARTAFQLANLLSYQERWEAALRYYDLAWTHRWLGALPLNNKGVALACRGETRAAFGALTAALQFDAGCAPACYNIAILYEKLGNEGTLALVLLDRSLGGEGQRAGEFARAHYERALAGSWPDTGPPGRPPQRLEPPLDRPLLLWTEDLKPGFGFEPLARIVNLDEAYDFYDQAIELLENEQWEEAIPRLEGAARLYPDLAARIETHRTQAEVQIAHAGMAEVRRRWDAGDYEGASRTFDELLARSALLPDRAFAEEILATGIESLAARIRSHRPEDGWVALQKLITQARQRFERNEGTGGESAPPQDTAGEPDQGAATASSPVEVELDDRGVAAREYIREVCRDAWSREIDRRIAAGDLGTAIQILAFSEIQWFAKRDLPDWRQRIYTAQAEILRARGQGQREEDWRSALASWREGREAAVFAADPPLVDSFDVLTESLLSGLSTKERTEARRLLHGADDREALRRCAADLKADPGDPRLLTRRHALVGQLLAQAHGALEAHQEVEAQEMVGEVLAVVPDHSEALKLLRAVREGLSERLLAQAEKAYLEQDYEPANELCAQVSPLFSDLVARARELGRRIEIARSLAAEESAYDEIFEAFLAAQKQSDPGERARESFAQAIRLRELAPRAAHTREAVEWAVQIKLDWLKARFEKSRTKEEAQQILDDLEPLLGLRPDFEMARGLRAELRKLIGSEGAGPWKKHLAELSKARAALVAGDFSGAHFSAALEAVRKVLQLGDQDLCREALAYKEEILEELRRRVEEVLAGASHTSDESLLAELDGLLEICRPWAPAFAAAKRAEADRLRQEIQEKIQAKGEFEDLRKKIGELAGRPLSALQELDRTVRKSFAMESSLLRHHRPQILVLRRNLERLMTTPWQRASSWIYERSSQTAHLYREDSDE